MVYTPPVTRHPQPCHLSPTFLMSESPTPTTPPQAGKENPKRPPTQEYANRFWDKDTTFLFSDVAAVESSQTGGQIIKMFDQNTPATHDFDEADLALSKERFGPTSPFTLLNPATDLIYVPNEALFYYWRGTHYFPLQDQHYQTGNFASMLRQFLLYMAKKKEDAKPSLSVNAALVAELRTAVMSLPLNIVKYSGAPRYLAIKNGTLDLLDPTFPIIPNHDQSRPAFRYLDVDSALFTQPTPAFDHLLESAFPNDDEMQSYVLEMLAYYFIPQRKEPACFFLYGVAASGKSTLLDLIRVLLSGENYYSALSIQSLTLDKYAVANLAGKLANIYDEDESGRVDIGKLKGLISGAPTGAERKYQQGFTLTPFAKFLFAGNQLPDFSHPDDGTMRRLHFIEFTHTIPEDARDKELGEKLITELSGIVGKILRSARTFLARNQTFLIPAKAKALKETFREENNPVIGFIHETYEIPKEDDLRMIAPLTGPPYPNNFKKNPWLKCEDIYLKYVEWIKNNGMFPLRSPKFFSVLSKEFPNMPVTRTKQARYRALIPKDEWAAMVPVHRDPLI